LERLLQKLWPPASIWFAAFMFMAVICILVYYHIWSGLFVVLAFLLFLWFFGSELRKPAAGAIIFTIVVTLYFQFSLQPIPTELPEQANITMEGRVVGRPLVNERGTRFVLHTNYKDTRLKHIQVISPTGLDIQTGDRLRIRGKLKAPLSPGNPGAFNYPRYLSYQEIYYLLSLKEGYIPENIEGPGIYQQLVTGVQYRVECVIKSVLTEQQAAIMLGMLLGSIESIDPDQYEDFQKVGIVHVFSVSGLHVGFLILLSGWVCALSGASRRTKLLSGLILLFIYGSLIYWPVAVTRASIMAALGLIAYYYGRPDDILNSLGLAGIIIMFIEPYAIFQISFQLSFMATWGLIYLFPVIRAGLPWQNRWLDMALLPLAAELAVIPLVIYHFNLLSVISLLSNIVITWLVGGAVILGFLAMLICFLPLMASLFLYPAGLFATIITKLVAFMVAFPGAYFWVATPPVYIVVLYYAGLCLLIWQIRLANRNKTVMLSAVAIMSVLLLVVFWPASWQNWGKLEVVFVDVGQGDSTLIKTPRGKFILLDGGGSDFSEIPDRTLIPYLRHRGIRHVDMLINSHPDTDHLQGIERVAEKFSVDYVAVPKVLKDSERYNTLYRLTQNKRIQWLYLQGGQQINFDSGVRIKVLYPASENRTDNNPNNLSAVIKIDYKQLTLLMPGDIEQDGIKKLIADKDLAAVSVVKVPHHGSRYSLVPEFYQQIKPGFAVISVGNNNFGHPSPEVIDFLKNHGSIVYRTDHDGAITFVSDGYKLQVKNYKI
jgi:competence protein ComEC